MLIKYETPNMFISIKILELYEVFRVDFNRMFIINQLVQNLVSFFSSHSRFSMKLVIGSTLLFGLGSKLFEIRNSASRGTTDFCMSMSR